jgi:hypothetical protein
LVPQPEQHTKPGIDKPLAQAGWTARDVISMIAENNSAPIFRSIFASAGHGA